MIGDPSGSYRPLAGLRVLELAQNLAGPYCGQILADLGADVIKVERTGGDSARAWGPPFVGGTGSIFAAANRGKRSIVLDLRVERDAGVLRRLVERADILIEAFRPGALAALGFSYETVRDWNDRLIYCSVLAYGERGPLSDLPGYDPLMQAHAGLMSVTGPASGEKSRIGTSVVDMGTGMWLGMAVLAALRERDATGTGRRLSVSLYDTALAWNAYHLAGYAATGEVPRPMGSEMPMIVPYGAFPASDGEVMIAAANDSLFVKLCNALAIEAAVADPRFATNPLRVEHRGALNPIVAAATAQFTRVSLMETLRSAGVPCAPIQDAAQVMTDAQTVASEMILDGRRVALADSVAHVDVAHAAMAVPGTREATVGDPGDTVSVALPVRWGGVRWMADSAVPGAGEHTAEILAELATAK